MQFSSIDEILAHIGGENQCIRLYAVYTEVSPRSPRMSQLIKGDFYDFNTSVLDINLSYNRTHKWYYVPDVFITLSSIIVKPNGNIKNLLNVLDTTSLIIKECYQVDYYGLEGLMFNGNLTFFTSLKEAKDFLKGKHKSLYTDSIKDLDVRLKKYKKRMYKKIDEPNFKQKEFNQILKSAKKYKYKLSQYANS